MSKRNSDKYSRRRIQTSFITTVISISLVLFMLGLLSALILYSKKISNYVQENIGIDLVINDNATEKETMKLISEINKKQFVKSTKYITKETAAKELKQDLGEDFISFLGYNPLLPSIEVHLKANYANADSLKFIEKYFKKNKLINETIYQKSLVNLVNENIKRFSLVILVFAGLLLIISMFLINNTIRLAVYSKRFIIKSMLLIGATQSFIRRPFILRGILEGILGGLFANTLLAALLYFAQNEIPDLVNKDNIYLFEIIAALVFFIGIFISWVSNFLAVRKYLKTHVDFLY